MQYGGVGSGVGKPKTCRFGGIWAAFLPKFALSRGKFGVTCCTTFLACEMLNLRVVPLNLHAFREPTPEPTRWQRTEIQRIDVSKV